MVAVNLDNSKREYEKKLFSFLIDTAGTVSELLLENKVKASGDAQLVESARLIGKMEMLTETVKWIKKNM